MKRFTLYGSPHSLPTYKVALMLSLSGEPFSFRYVSFQKGMHKAPEFSAYLAGGRSPFYSTMARPAEVRRAGPQTLERARRTGMSKDETIIEGVRTCSTISACPTPRPSSSRRS